MGAFPSSAELDAINGNPETHPRIRTTSRLNVDTLKVSGAPGHAACLCWFCVGQPWACRKRLVHRLPAPGAMRQRLSWLASCTQHVSDRSMACAGSTAMPGL